MKKVVAIGMLLASGAGWAQVPAEERAARVDPLLQHQQRAEYARSEREKAAANVAQAQQQLEDAKRAQYDAEKQLHQAKQRTLKAQQDMDRARASLEKAQATEARTLH